MKKIAKKILSGMSKSKLICKFSKKINECDTQRVSTSEQKEYQRLAQFYENNKNIKLHFGCGPRVLKGWVNIDLFFVPFEKYLKAYTNEYYPETLRGGKEDFYGVNIIKTGLPLPDNSVDLIFHEDFLEHLNQVEQFIFLAETFRVLKPGAIHRVSTPNLLFCMKNRSDFKKGKSGICVNDWYKSEHKNMLTPSIIKEMALMVGYSDIVFNNKDKSLSKEIPKEYRPGIGRINEENIFVDLIK